MPSRPHLDIFSIVLCLLILATYIDKIFYCITSNNCICLYISGFNVYDFINNVYTRTIIWVGRYIRNALLLLLLSNFLLGGAN